MNDFLFIAKKLGMIIYKIDLEHDKVYFLDHQFQEPEDTAGENWTAYLEQNREKFMIDGSTETLSLSNLKMLYSQGKESEEYELAESNVRIFFSRDITKGMHVYILETKLSEKDLLKRVVDQYVFNNNDYFILLSAKNGSYVTLNSSNNGTPLLPDASDDYEREMRLYVEQFVVEEDREMAIQEMKISRILEQLGKNEKHVFYMGIMEPLRGYRRKQLEYRCHSKRCQRVMLSGTDITDMWLTEKKRQNEYIEVLKKASTDPLTGILNLRAFKDNVLESMELDKEHAAFLFLDLDNFKAVNDTYGHAAGDKLLKKVAHILREETRKVDFVGRVGGDEFIIYLDGIQQREDVKKVAERICDRIRKLDKLDEKKIQISCSIGIATAPEDGIDYDSLVNEADRRLYLAKENGKNGFYMDE